jgi:hypothetical protein
MATTRRRVPGAPFLRLRLGAYASIAPRPAILERTHTCAIPPLLPSTAIEIVSLPLTRPSISKTVGKVRVVTRPAREPAWQLHARLCDAA